MKFEKLFEIRALDLDTREMTSVWYTGDYSFIDLQQILGNENMELDEEETLQIYLDHDWVEENIVLIVNNEELMDTPLKELIHNYNIYDMVHEIAMGYIRG